MTSALLAILSAALLAAGASKRDQIMTSQSGIARVRGLIANFFNAHDPSVAREYFTDDVRWHGMSVGDYEGVEGYARTMAAFWRALPDAHATEQDAIENGDRVVMRFVVEATHRGELWGIPGTGRRVRWDATMIYRMEGGKIAEQWAAEDWAAILRDVGAAKLSHAKPDGSLARGLVRIGEDAIERENDAAYDAYFAENYVLHGPLGDMTRDELKRYFASLRAAFSNFKITRERILTDGNWLAARNTMSGTFDHVFEMSPIGPVQPNGQHVRFEVVNIFRYDGEGRLLEEWVQVDNLGLLRQLGVRTSFDAGPRKR